MNKLSILWCITCVAVSVILYQLWNSFDKSGYLESLNDVNYNGNVGYFPKEFGDDLRPIKYSHEFPMLQGGGHIQLLCNSKSPNSIWLKYFGQFEYWSNGINAHYIQDGENRIDSKPLVTLLINGYSGELDSNWKIGVLKAIRGIRHAEQPWNHGDTYGIAVNESRGLVLYWCATW